MVRTRARALIIFISALVLVIPGIPTASAQAPNCPTINWRGEADASEPKVMGVYFPTNDQFLHRVDSSTKQMVNVPSSLVGCYMRINPLNGDVNWNVAIIDRDAGGYFWRNAAGRTWRLNADFSNLRLLTGPDYPYQSLGKNVDLVLGFDESNPKSCRIFSVDGRFSPGFSRTHYLTYGRAQSNFELIIMELPEDPIKIDSNRTLDSLELPKVEAFYSAQSYGKFNLDIKYSGKTTKVSGKVSDYANSSSKMMAEAFREFQKAHPVRDYDGLIFALPIEYTHKDAGYASILSSLTKKYFEDGNIRITWMGSAPFGWKDPNAAPWKVLAHEIGHNLGLADLYATQGGDLKGANFLGKTIGPFDIMGSLSAPANELTFWNRWLLNWITDSQIRCITDLAKSTSVDLTPITDSNQGTKGVVVPLSLSTALLIESRKAQGYDSGLKGDETGIVVYKIDTSIGSGSGPIRVIAKTNQYSDTLFTQSLVDAVRFLKAPLQPGESLVTEGITIVNVGDNSTDAALIFKGEDSRPKPLISVNFEASYNLTQATVNISANSNSSAKIVAKTESSNICEISGDKIKFMQPGDCVVALSQGANRTFAASEANLVTFKITDDREVLRAERKFYQDQSACHPTIANAALQVLADGIWRDFAPAQGWIRNSGCPATHPVQPWVVAELASKTTYRWRIYSSAWTQDFFSPTYVSPLTLSDEKLEIERAAAEAKAAAEAAAKRAPAKTKIICFKGKQKKVITAKKPKCPAGFKKR